MKLWDVATGQELSTYRGHHGDVTSIAFSPSGKQLMSGGRDKTIRIWDATRNPEALVLRGHTRAVTGAAFSVDGTRLVTVGMDNTSGVDVTSS